MDIEERTNDLLQELLTSNSVSDGIKTKAQEILDDKFKDEVRLRFGYLLNDKDVDKYRRNTVMSKTKCAFIEAFYGFENLQKFLDDNYDKMDKIIRELRKLIREFEEAENKTED